LADLGTDAFDNKTKGKKVDPSRPEVQVLSDPNTLCKNSFLSELRVRARFDGGPSDTSSADLRWPFFCPFAWPGDAFFGDFFLLFFLEIDYTYEYVSAKFYG
jgi:hypothetical protein